MKGSSVRTIEVYVDLGFLHCETALHLIMVQ